MLCSIGVVLSRVREPHQMVALGGIKMEFNEIKYGNHPGAEDEYYMDLKFKELIVIFNMAITCESGEKFDKEELIKSFVGYVNQRLEEIIKKV